MASVVGKFKYFFIIAKILRIFALTNHFHMKHRFLLFGAICGAALATALPASGLEPPVRYDATVWVNGSTGDFAPYFIGALNGGKTVRSGSAALDVKAVRTFDMNKRFSWGAGAEIVAGAFSGNDYRRWDEAAKEWGTRENRPSAAWIQQLYGEIKYRAVFLRAGQKSHESRLLDERIASGDLTRGSNARGIPGMEIGFIDFQDIPFTNGWVQIDGVVEYGRFTDDGFKKKQFGYYNYLTTTDICYTYKRCYFRTKPSMPLSLTIGMQTAGQFSGSTYYYRRGDMFRADRRGFKFKDVFKMFFPTEGNGNSFYEGNSLGSWDVKLRYRLPDASDISFVFMGPWEDGSGIGRMNGADGLWGLYYHAADSKAIVSGAGIEYLDFRNQSGPIHYEPNDHPGTDITSNASGADNYYNNDTYGSYSNYGVAIATPFLVAPVYNLDGNPYFAHNRARGFHAAVEGNISPVVSYRLKYSWQQAWGMGRISTARFTTSNSAFAEVAWNASAWADGLSMTAQLAFDAGKLRGNNFGALVSVTYSGDLTFTRGK